MGSDTNSSVTIPSSPVHQPCQSSPSKEALKDRLEMVVWELRASRNRTRDLEGELGLEHRTTAELESDFINLMVQYVNKVVSTAPE